jgi:hypothetical protein
VNAILEQPRDVNRHLSIFFCEYDNAESLKSRTILRCLIRQCLSADTMSTTIEDMLKNSFRASPPDPEDLESILQQIARDSELVILVIDGFDECAQADRDIVLKALQRLIASNPKSVKVFISSREDLFGDIGRTFINCRELNMNCDEAGEDIPRYIRETVNEKLEKGELVVGDPAIIREIQEALIQGAKGM